MIFEVIDDDGILGLVNAQLYNSFINSDWTYDEIISHFVKQMNKNSLIVWRSNLDGGGSWLVECRFDPTDKRAFRTFKKSIVVTDRCLYLSTYTDLSMAAQFPDEVIPSKINADLKFELDNGKYEVIMKQLFDSAKEYDSEPGNIAFEIVFNKAADVYSELVEDLF